MTAARARTHTVVTARRVAGILPYRHAGRGVEVLLLRDGTQVHSGRNKGVWTMPRAVHPKSEDARQAAAEAYRCDVGGALPADALESLGSTRLRGDRLMAAWACAGEPRPTPDEGGSSEAVAPAETAARRLEWFALDEALRRIKPRQRVFIDRLRTLLPAEPGEKRRAHSRGRHDHDKGTRPA